MQNMRDITNEDRHRWRWRRCGQRWIVALVTARGTSYLGWGGIGFEPAVEPLRDADLAEIVTAARRCMTKCAW